MDRMGLPRTMSITPKLTPWLLVWALASASGQDLDKLPPAERAKALAQNAALTAQLDAGAKLPPPIEEAGVTPYDLNDYNKPLVLLVSVDRASG